MCPLDFARKCAVENLCANLGSKEHEKKCERACVSAGVGHCPMDEAPEMVNPKTLAFVERHSPLAEVDELV